MVRGGGEGVFYFGRGEAFGFEKGDALSEGGVGRGGIAEERDCGADQGGAGHVLVA